jgi:hypothetical protein
LRSLRWAAFAVYLVVFVSVAEQRGLPIGRDRVMLWILPALLIACIGRSWTMAALVFADWIPFGAVLMQYDVSRGWADRDGVVIHYTPQIEADRWLFFGHDPVVFVHEFFYGGLAKDAEPWWRLLFDAAYLSHYLVPFVLAGILWARNRRRFLQWSRRFVTLSFVGFATYALFPAAPPWMAERDGFLPPEVRRENSVLLNHMHVVRNVFEDSRDKFNQVAAVPSLHAAFTVLFAAFLWSRTPRWGRPFLALYPLTMGLALVARGEHYVVDVILGAIYAVGVHLAFNHIDAWWDGRLKPAFYTSGYYMPAPRAWLTKPVERGAAG